jgi:hypothetical protein
MLAPAKSTLPRCFFTALIGFFHLVAMGMTEPLWGRPPKALLRSQTYQLFGAIDISIVLQYIVLVFSVSSNRNNLVQISLSIMLGR